MKIWFYLFVLILTVGCANINLSAGPEADAKLVAAQAAADAQKALVPGQVARQQIENADLTKSLNQQRADIGTVLAATQQDRINRERATTMAWTVASVFGLVLVVLILVQAVGGISALTQWKIATRPMLRESEDVAVVTVSTGDSFIFDKHTPGQCVYKPLQGSPQYLMLPKAVALKAIEARSQVEMTEAASEALAAANRPQSPWTPQNVAAALQAALATRVREIPAQVFEETADKS